MAKLSVQEIKNRAKEIIAANPGGVRYSVLVNKICTDYPETPKNTVAGSVWNLEEVFPTEITKPSRGLFTPINAGSTDQAAPLGETEQVAPTGVKIYEYEFYRPFADWLKNDLDEVTEVSALGGAGIKSKWGTPDVIGV
jgi:hypothetical protein